ncbi:MAG: dihydrodipicolinate synthase family protein [Burkholderiaceae bacterium]
MSASVPAHVQAHAQTSTRERALAGVVPVLPTPFTDTLMPDMAALRRLVRYLLRCGVDGIAYPGVASEVAQLSESERSTLVAVVLEEVAGRVPVVVGASSAALPETLRLARTAADAGASVLMVAAPADPAGLPAQRVYFTAVAEAAGAVPLMLQNLPAPGGADLAPELLADLLDAVPQIRYVKEEALPSGQRLTALRERAPAHLLGLFGGAGGRYIVGELARGASGTMPAIELAEVHVALWGAHRRGDDSAVRALFMRMLPVLNLQAVFRWALTKQVLQARGLIACTAQRTPGPRLDRLDADEVNTLLTGLRDLLLGADELTALS